MTRCAVLPDNYVEFICSAGVNNKKRRPVTEDEMKDFLPKMCRSVRKVSLEFLALLIKRREASRQDEYLFHQKLEKLVFRYCHRFKVTCYEEFDDLVSECWRSIWRRFHSYSPFKGAVTTWATQVCTSTLNRRFRRCNKYKNEVNVEGCGLENVVTKNIGVDKGETFWHEELMHCITYVFEECGDKSRELVALFGGHPKDGNFQLPGKINVADGAEKAGVGYSKMYNFYTKTVRPIMQNRLIQGGFVNA